MLTNWSTIQKQIEKLKEWEQREIEGHLDSLSKKEYINNVKKLINYDVYLLV